MKLLLFMLTIAFCIGIVYLVYAMLKTGAESDREMGCYDDEMDNQ